MEKDENALAQGGMKFFGRMSASATHEIKNILAIINESAGLLEDLSVMAGKGHPLSFERTMDISQRVTRQVRRADLVVKKLNQLSHSVDHSMGLLDLEKTVCFVLDLGSRLVESQGACVKVTPPVSPIQVSSNLLYLENMIWRAIEAACRVAEGKKQIMVSFGSLSAVPSIWFSMDRVNNRLMDNLLESEEDRALMGHLRISLEKNNEKNGFGLIWLKNI